MAAIGLPASTKCRTKATANSALLRRSAFTGLNSSTCSTPSVARTATSNLRVLASSVSGGLEGTSPLTIQSVSLSLPCACAWPLPSLLKRIAPLPDARRLPCLRACRPCVTERG